MKGKRILIISIITSIVIIIASLYTMLLTKVNNTSSKIDVELLRSMNYTEIIDDDSKVDGCDYVKFSAFFTRDIDGDGNANKLLGTCRKVNSTDVLYINLNVLTNGYLENGKITINGTNFNYSMNMVKDSVLKNNYISDNVKKIELNTVKAGTQKLILGDIISNIGNNINNYSRGDNEEDRKVNSITLTGTHVTDEGVRTEISKTINLTVDWYGDVKASLYTYGGSVYYNYDNLESSTISLSFRLDELQKELLLQGNAAKLTIPELNGYSPIEVTCTNSNVKTEYNEATREFSIYRESVSEDGIIKSSVSSSNTYTVNITYPQDAYNQISSYTTLTVPIEGYYVGYNNKNEGFENPKKSNIANGKITVIFRETPQPTGYIYDFDVKLADKKYVSKPSYRYVISKQDLLNLYDNEEYKANFEYTVKWYAFRGTKGEVSSMIMSETKEDSEEMYGDKFDQTIMQEYTTNKGIYFDGQDKMLGENGTISVYNNDTNELIKIFTKEDWNTYNVNNPYIYKEPVKHVRVETSTATTDSTLIVSNVKELDAKKIVQDFTKEQIKAVELVYTYLTGTANIEGQASGTVKDTDYAYYVSETSYAKIEIEKNKLSTQETCNNQKIYVSTEVTQTGDAKWRNGEFLVEIPKDIINMEINNVSINNENVRMVAYDLFQKDGKYFIKIVTENETLATYKITIDCNMTPDPRIPTSNKDLKLYAYNEYCNEYYYVTKDTYDVDSDNNTEEQVGTSSIRLNLLSPTSLLTLEKISNYNEENEITIAPNVAEVERDTRQATVNIDLTNNYPNTVTGVKILGKIPFEGNTYILNGKDLKSGFTTEMTNAGIQVPEELKEKAIVYYSENENPSKDLENSKNGWTLKENVQDFSKIKTYLIDLREYTIEVGKGYTFNYIVNIPENINYNLAAYSDHAVYYELNTEGGNLQLSTEPNKVGIRIVKKFDLELTKYKMNSNVTIPEVIYTLKYEEENVEGELEEKTRILTTNNEGKIVLKNLHVEKEYKLQEFRVPDTCELNAEEISFTVNADGTVTLNGTVRNHNFANGEILQVELEDEVKYKVEINKTKIGGSFEIDGARFKLEDEQGNRSFVRTQSGKAILEGLSLNKVYTISETAAPANCELNNGLFKFKLIRENGTINIVTIENSLLSGTPVVQDLEDELTPVLKVNVQNEIKYTLDLTKQNKEGKKLSRVQFSIKGEGFSSEGSKFATSSEGKIFVYGLSFGKTYTIEEIKVEDYYLEPSKNNTIEFKVDRTSDGLQVTTWNKGDGILQVGTANISERDLNATLSVVLENEKIPTYNLKLVKVNKDGEKLQGAQFKLTSLDTNKEQTITIGENGEGTFENLYEYIDGKYITGEYILEETFAPEGYALDVTKLKFKATRDENGKVQITIIEGANILKENTETNEKEITSDEETLTLNILNKPIFTLKKYGDNGTLLPNARFLITDLDGNLVRGTDGKIVGVESKTITFTKSDINPWTQNEDGTWISGNKGKSNSTSVLVSDEFKINSKETLSFDWSVSSESASYDYVYYTITNVDTNAIIGGTSNKIGGINYGTTYESLQFTKVEQELQPGTYTITFTYRKDGSVDRGTDSGYVRDIEVRSYRIATNEKGEISANLPEGMYKAIEVEAPEGYKLPENEKDRTYYFGIERSQEEVKGSVAGSIEWAKSIKSKIDSELESVISTDDGGAIAVGTTYANIDINGDGIVDNLGKGSYDGIIVKYDEDGNIEWSKILGGTNEDELYSIAKDPNGGYVIAGSTDSTEVYLDNTLIDTRYFGNKDGILVKIDDSGNYVWSQSIGGTGVDRINSVTVSESGDIAVVGSYTSTEINIDKAETDVLTNLGAASKNKNAFITVYSTNGAYKWSQNIGGTEDTIGSSVTVTNSGFVVTVNFIDTAYLNTAKTTSITSKGKVDGVIIAYDGNGNIVWNKQIGSAENEALYQVITDKDGNVIVVGGYGAEVDLDGDGTNDLKTKGVYDGMVVKYTGAGDYITHKSIGGTDDDTISAVATTRR